MDNNNPLGGTNLTYSNESRRLYASLNHENNDLFLI